MINFQVTIPVGPLYPVPLPPPQPAASTNRTRIKNCACNDLTTCGITDLFLGPGEYTKKENDLGRHEM